MGNKKICFECKINSDTPDGSKFTKSLLTTSVLLRSVFFSSGVMCNLSCDCQVIFSNKIKRIDEFTKGAVS